MRVEAQRPVGAEVGDLSLAELGPTEVENLRLLLAEHGVLAFRGQDLDDAGFLAFLRGFAFITPDRASRPSVRPFV